MSAPSPFQPASLSKSDAELVDAIALLIEFREEHLAAQRNPGRHDQFLSNRTRLLESEKLQDYVCRTPAESLTVLLMKAELALGDWAQQPRAERDYQSIIGRKLSVIEQLVATLRTVREPIPAAVMR